MEKTNIKLIDTYTLNVSEIEVYLQKDIVLLQEDFFEKSSFNKFDHSKLDEAKVYFLPGTVFSREDFREAYPNAKIVRKIEDADCMIWSKKTISTNYGNKKTYYRYAENSYTRYYNSTYEDLAIKNGIQYSQVGIVFPKKDDCTPILNKALALENLKFINIAELNIGSKPAMPLKDYRFMETSMTSHDPEMFELGCLMFREYDYNKSKSRMALLLLKANWNIRRNVYSHVKFKTTYQKLKADFPNLKDGIMFKRQGVYVNSFDVLRSLFEIVQSDPSDLLLQQELSNKLKDYLGLHSQFPVTEFVIEFKKKDDIFALLEEKANVEI